MVFRDEMTPTVDLVQLGIKVRGKTVAVGQFLEPVGRAPDDRGWDLQRGSRVATASVSLASGSRSRTRDARCISFTLGIGQES